MGRSSSTGYPYLILRPDAGQFTYYRAVDRSVAPFVIGEVRIAWCPSSRILTGKPTIKISLATGDLKTAQQRWVNVHAQVDALVRLAKVQAHQSALHEPLPPIEPLERAHIRILAGQTYHDVLDADDRAQIDPEHGSALADLLLRLAPKVGQQGTAVERQVAELAARGIERSIARSRLRHRTTWVADRPITESELDHSALGQLSPALKVGDRLAPEQKEALARGTRIGEIPSEVDARLQENGIVLPADHIARRAVALAITRAKLRGLDDVAKRDRGAPIDTPERPSMARSTAIPGEKATPPLSSMRPLWIAERRPGDKERDDKALYLKGFIDLHGDLPVDQITRPMVSNYLHALERRPRNLPHALRGASLQDQVAWGSRIENRGKPRMKRGTVNAKGLGAISALLEQALKLGHVSENACKGMALPLRPDDTLERMPYALEDLQRIFSSGAFSMPLSAELRGADQWLPLLALFTGARLEELGQLTANDIKLIDGVNCVEITDVDDPDQASATGKSLKTAAARRLVPLHQGLIDVGFLHFVQAQRAKRQVLLFPELALYKGRRTKEWSKKWGRFTDKHVTDAPEKSFHSFRHLLIAMLREAGVAKDLIKALVGHQIDDVTLRYGRQNGAAFSVAMLNEALQKFRVPGLDLSRFRAA